MIPPVTFTVVGTPVPQGSKRAFKTPGGAVVMAEANKAHKPWRAEVVAAARAEAPSEPFAGPVEVHLWFRFLPVASDPYRTYHASAPDIDKLARTVLDALSVARVIVDDARVCELAAHKRYCDAHETPGVSVYVFSLEDIEAQRRVSKKEAAAAARKAAKALAKQAAS